MRRNVLVHAVPIVCVLLVALGPLSVLGALPPQIPDPHVQRVSWSTDVSFTFRGRTVDIPEGVWAASDGESFLYVTRDASVPLADPQLSPCVVASPPSADGPMVLIDHQGCFWVAYPGIACSLYTEPCDGGASPQPPETPSPDLDPLGLLGGASTETVTNDQYLQFGVGILASGITSEGVNGQIIMNTTSEAYSFTSSTHECHYRWPGMSWGGTFTNRPFIQIGTTVCNYDTNPNTDYGVFCDYFDQNGGQHRADMSSRFSFSTSWHQYSYETTDGSTTYRCIRDGSSWAQFTVYSASTSSPYMWSVAEASAVTTGLDTTKETFTSESHNLAVQRVSGTFGFNLAHENWYFSALGGSTGPCSFNLGADLMATENILPGSGRACHTNGASAW